MFQKAPAPTQTIGSSTRAWSVFEIPKQKQSLQFYLSCFTGRLQKWCNSQPPTVGWPPTAAKTPLCCKLSLRRRCSRAVGIPGPWKRGFPVIPYLYSCRISSNRILLSLTKLTPLAMLHEPKTRFKGSFTEPTAIHCASPSVPAKHPTKTSRVLSALEKSLR